MEASTHPCHKVHSSSSVQQKSGYIDISIVSSDVEGGETTLMGGSTRRRKDKQIFIINQTIQRLRYSYIRLWLTDPRIPSYTHCYDRAEWDFPHNSKESIKHGANFRI